VDLTQSLVHGDADGGGQIQAADFAAWHRNSNRSFRIPFKQAFGQTVRFASEEQAIFVLIGDLRVRNLGMSAKAEYASIIQSRFEFRQGRMTVPLDQRPIVDTRAPQRFVIQTKSEPANQVQGGSGCSAKSGDVAGVRRNLRFPQSDVEHGLRQYGDCEFSNDN